MTDELKKKIVTIRRVKVDYLTYEGFIKETDEYITIDDGRHLHVFPLSEKFSILDAP